jgi:DNA-binding IclR family transcriptional regulator
MIKKNDGVKAAQRAVSLLLAFTARDRTFTLAELSRRTDLDKATVLRLARTLAANGFLFQNSDSSWRLGPALAQLGTIYQETFVLGDVVASLLKDLSETTGESAAIYVREGDRRVCLYRHNSEQSIRHHIVVGVPLPLELGAPGRIILAFEGTPGEPYETVRRQGYYLSKGERDPQVSNLAMPLFKNGVTLFGALAVAGPPNRFTPEAMEGQLAALRRIGRQVSLSLGGDTAIYGQDQDQ